MSIHSRMRGVLVRKGEALEAVSAMWGPEWLTPSEAALLTGIPSQAVRELIAEGRLHPSGDRASTTLVRAAELGAVLRELPSTGVRPTQAAEQPVAEGGTALEAPPEDGSRRSRARRALELLVVVTFAGVVARSLFLTPAADLSGESGGRPNAPSLPAAPPTQLLGPGAPSSPPTPVPVTIEAPLFRQHGSRVAAVASVTNPNSRWWVRSVSLLFVVRDRHGREVARHSTRVSLSPNGSIRAIAPAMVVRPPHASASSVVLHAHPARWAPTSSFVPPGLHIEGVGVSASPDGKVAVVAMVANPTDAEASGTFVCATANAAGGLTGAVRVTLALPAHQQGPVSIPVSDPAPGSVAADCEIGPASR